MTRSAVRFVSALGMTAAVVAGVTLPTVAAEAAAARAIHAAALPKTGTASAYFAQAPKRILDTRSTGQRLTGGTLNLTVAGGSTTVPASAGAVVLNVTVTGTVGAGFLTVWPTGNVMPTVSNLNWAAGDVRPNLVTVQVGTGGQVSLYANSPTDVVVDEEGYYGTQSGTAGGYVAVTPARITDTRAGSGFANAGSTLGADTTLSVQVTGAGGVPSTGVSGVVLNATVTNTTGSSYLTVWPAGGTMPTVSNLNWVPGWVVPNRVEVPIGTGGKVNFFNKFGSTDLVVDVDGYYTDATAVGRLFVPMNPTRVIDTRVQGGTLGQGGSSTYQVTGFAGVPAGASAALFNVTVTNTTAASYLTVYPGGGTRPTASDLNWVAGQTIPNMTVATLSTSGSVSFYNNTGSTDLIADLSGYFASGTAFQGVTVAANPSTVPADGATTSKVTATVTGSTGTPVSGDAVLFSKTAGTTGSCGGLVPTSGVTNSLGQVTVTYTASSTVGTCTITATEANTGGSGTVLITQSTPPNTVSVAPASASVAANGSSTQTFTATVLNPSGTAVSGDTVSWVASGTCGTMNPASGTTNSSGQATSVYISSTTAGWCTIKATESATGGSGSANIDQTTSPAPAGAPYGFVGAVGAKVTFSPATLPADGSSTATASATVKDTAGAGAAVAGDQVLFTKGAGCTNVLLNGGSQAVATTNSLGVASVTYTAGTTVGACTINVQEAATAATGSGNEAQTAVPNTNAVVANPSSISASGTSTSTITDTVTSPSGVAVSGDTVAFTTSTVGGACGTLSPTTGVTNSSGQVAVAYISSTTSGFCTITATDNGTGTPAGTGGSGTATITQTSGTGNTITGSASPSSLPADGTSTSTVSATVKNSSGAAVAGDVVSFAKGTGCGSLTPASGSATTNSSGVASITYTVNTTVGTCTLTATEAGSGASTTIAITQTAAPNVVAVTPATATVSATGSATQTFVANVTTFSGTSVSADTVTFTVGGSPAAACGTMNPASGSTNSSGNVTSVYISSTTSGFCTITATESGTGGSGTAVVDQTTSPAPANIPYTITAVTFSPASVPADSSTTATASVTVKDSLAAGVAGDTVRFSKGAGCTGVLLNGGSSATAVTNSAGTASVTYTAGSAVGTCTINAQEASTAKVGTGGEVQTAVPDSVTVVANPSSVTANGTSSSTISITVTDSSGNAVGAQALAITKSGTPAAACGTVPATATTNASGQASVVYISSTTTGFCTVTVTETGAAPHNGSGSVTITQHA
jgi:adhesin/invasin